MLPITTRFIVGDTVKVLPGVESRSVDLIVTSPPFLNLRDYTPNNPAEIGQEPDPASFLTTLLNVTEEFARIITPYGSICVELGDNYTTTGRDGWPGRKSLAMIPHLYASSLAYGRNLLTGQPCTPWIVRNMVVWARPNPPVGLLTDRFKTGVSYITVASLGPDRWFDMDAVRIPINEPLRHRAMGPSDKARLRNENDQRTTRPSHNQKGAIPLDWHADGIDGPNGDTLWWMVSTNSNVDHYATFPPELPSRLIRAMCPLQVCVGCGTPRTRSDDGGTWSVCECETPTYRPGHVLDPFAGSGTTLAVAYGLGRSSTGIDLNPVNAEHTANRIGPLANLTVAG